MQNKVGVIGIGEVGNSLSKILSKYFTVLKKDIDYDEISDNKIEALHVCLPYNSRFIDHVVRQIKMSNPTITIIHSTTAVGVARKIWQKSEYPVVHSPVMGTHPNLEQDMKKFIKFIGPVDEYSSKLAIKHLKQAGFKIKVLSSSEETELGKLLDTTYFGWNIIFCKLVGNLCEKVGLDFDNVYTQFNQVYNNGYKKTKPHVIRPILKYKHPRDQGAGIGGHCVIPNAEILHSQFKTTFTDFILKENSKLKKK